MVFSASFVSQVLGPPAHQGTGEGFDRIHTDTRTLGTRDLYLPLKGDNFDGHDFIQRAIEAGTKGLITEEPFNGEGVWVWQVEDTLKAYRALAKAWLEQLSPKVLALGGSVGKTTAKELLATMMGPHTHKTHGSQNGFVGIPMTILALRPEHTYLVLEVGIDEPGAMAQHCELFTPYLALLTKLCEEHMSSMGSLETVIQEEMILLNESHRKGARVVVNALDPHILKGAENLSGILVGSPGVDVRLEGETLHVGGEAYPYVLHGEVLAQTQALATVAALEAGRSSEDIRASLSNFEPPQGRMNVTETDGVLLLADYYNALPAAMHLALDLLHEKSMGRSGQRWVCLGDMLETGPTEQAIHEALAEPIERYGFEQILLYGPRMKHLLAKLPKARHFEDHQALARALQPKAGDTVLIKGSRGMRMEKVVVH